MVSHPIGGLPGTSDSGADGASASTTSDSAADGHSSQSAGDDGTSETTFVPGDDDGDEGSTGDPSELCEHEPSGLEPGSVIWEQALADFVGRELLVMDGRTWLIGQRVESGALQFLRIGEEGVEQSGWTWSAPGGASSEPRHIAALPEGRVVFGVDVLGDDDCAWCPERRLLAFDDGDFVPSDPVWELSLGAGAWALTESVTGTVVVVGATSNDGNAIDMSLTEIDAEGSVIREVESKDGFVGEALGWPYRAAVGPSGQIFAIGAFAEGLGGNQGWRASWSVDLLLYWFEGTGSSDHRDIAATTNDDPIVVLHFDFAGPEFSRIDHDTAEFVWRMPWDDSSSSVATDCDGSIVVGGTEVQRLDGDGAVQWTTLTAGIAKVLAVDTDGSIIALVDIDQGNEVLLKLAGL